MHEPDQSTSPGSSMAVTAVVPIHNASATVARALGSIVAQTAPVQRIVVVDDASTDDSVAAVEGLGIANLEILRLAHNVGPGGARNAGVAHSQTEWVALLDADDYWEPTFLDEVLAAIARFHADFGSCGGNRIKAYRSRREVSRRILNRPPGAYDLTDDFWHVGLHFVPMHSSSTVVRRSLYLGVGGCPEDVRNGEDVGLFIRLWLGGKFAFVNQPLFTSEAVPSGLSAGPLAYHDVRLGLQRMVAALARSIRDRRRGSAWFAIWVGQRFIRRHASWLVRRLGLGRLLDTVRRRAAKGRRAAVDSGHGGDDTTA